MKPIILASLVVLVAMIEAGCVTTKTFVTDDKGNVKQVVERTEWAPPVVYSGPVVYTEPYYSAPVYYRPTVVYDPWPVYRSYYRPIYYSRPVVYGRPAVVVTRPSRTVVIGGHGGGHGHHRR